VQLCADIFGKALECDTVLHASLLGGVYLATQDIPILRIDPKLTNVPILEDVAADKKSEPQRSAQFITPCMTIHSFYQQRFQKYLRLYHS